MGQTTAPLKTLPSELKDVQTSIRSIEINMAGLNVTVKDVAESLKEVRRLRSDLDTFKVETTGRLERMQVEIDKLKSPVR